MPQEIQLSLKDLPNIIVFDFKEVFSIFNFYELTFELEIDHQEIIEFIFTQIKNKSQAEETIDYGLLAKASESFYLDSLGLLSEHSKKIELLFTIIKKASMKLISFLNETGCYLDDTLVYYPMRNLETDEPFQIVTDPFVMIRVDLTLEQIKDHV